MPSRSHHQHRITPGGVIAIALLLSALIHIAVLMCGGLRWVRTFAEPHPDAPLLIRLLPVPQAVRKIIAPNQHSASTEQQAPAQQAVTHRAPLPTPGPDKTVQTHQKVSALPKTPPAHPLQALSLGTLLSQAAESAGQIEQTVPPPKGRVVYGVTATGPIWDQYIDDWVAKMERIGQLNYPEEVRRQGLSGGPLLSVIINADGSLDSVRILRRSQNALLDEAAQTLVRRAAPFAPFPPELAKQSRSIEIRRKWTFSTSDSLSVR